MSSAGCCTPNEMLDIFFRKTAENCPAASLKNDAAFRQSSSKKCLEYKSEEYLFPEQASSDANETGTPGKA
ncbi:hypothetical protein [Acetobacter indonesiensis]|uniref:hypothetical protein n=2 Tax=Acetobacter indonesiensis TaxID=104101 RepID=UPI0015C52193|nr:hypothetical protein [Acetobacter indonesiensis]